MTSSASEPPSGATSDYSSGEQAQAVVSVPADDYQAVLDLARAEGVLTQEIAERGLVDPASITLILMGGSLAVSTVVYIIEQRKGGQVFDARANSPRPAYRSKDIAYGYVQIIAADGAVSVEVKEPRGMFGQVLDTLRLVIRDAIGSDAKTLQSLAKDAVGDMATVQTV